MLDDDNMEQDDNLDENTSETPASTQPATEERQKGTISADLIRGHINTIILRTLSERDKYGYEIIEEIERKSHGQYEIKQPTLYSALKRLENQGYIKAYWKTDEISAGGRRKYFTLTESGKEIAEKNRAEWEYSRTVIDNLISDQDYDFSRPAPNPVDFKILKHSTSRVPTVRLEETNEDNNEESNGNENNDNNETVVAYSYSEGNSQTINLDASQLQFDENSDAQSDNAIAEIEASETAQANHTEVIPEQPQAQQSQSSQNSEIVTEQPAAQAETPQSAEHTEQITPSSTQKQPAAYFSTESIQEAYGDQYEQVTAPAQQTPIPTDNNASNALTDDEQYKIQHENYLKLIHNNYGANGQNDNSPEYGDNLDTEKLIYINKPETERDYKNLVNDIYSQTIRPQTPVNNTANPPVNAPIDEVNQPYEQPIPSPVMEQQQVNTYYEVQSEESLRAESDGLRIFTADKQPKPTGRYTKNFNLGDTLFKSAAVTFAYLMVMFIIAISCRTALEVSLAYPFVIFGIACCLFAVCAVMALCGFGRNSVKPVSHNYIGVCAVLTVIAILIVCVTAILLNIDFGSAADVCRKIVIPSFTLLAVPLYSTMFYVFSK